MLRGVHESSQGTREHFERLQRQFPEQKEFGRKVLKHSRNDAKGRQGAPDD